MDGENFIHDAGQPPGDAHSLLAARPAAARMVDLRSAGEHMRPTFICLGGGGLSNGCDPALDDLVVRHCDPARLSIGFIGWASGDDPVKLKRFYDRLAASGCELDHRPLESASDGLEAWARSKGALYFSGGNTGRLLEHIRRAGLVEPLRRTWQTGTLIAGVSAGAIIWFEEAFSDAGGNGLAPLAGLGFVTGSCCPHYSGEPWRRPAFEAAVAAGLAAPGIAIDDGVAVIVSHGREPVAVSARAGAWAYRVERGRDGARVGRLAGL